MKGQSRHHINGTLSFGKEDLFSGKLHSRTHSPILDRKDCQENNHLLYEDWRHIPEKFSHFEKQLTPLNALYLRSKWAGYLIRKVPATLSIVCQTVLAYDAVQAGVIDSSGDIYTGQYYGLKILTILFIWQLPLLRNISEKNIDHCVCKLQWICIFGNPGRGWTFFLLSVAISKDTNQNLSGGKKTYNLLQLDSTRVCW